MASRKVRAAPASPPRPGEGLEASGEARLGAREGRQRHEAQRGVVATRRYQVAGAQEGSDGLAQPVGLNTQQFGRRLGQFPLRQQRVALIARGAERVEGAGLVTCSPETDPLRM